MPLLLADEAFHARGVPLGLLPGRLLLRTAPLTFTLPTPARGGILLAPILFIVLMNNSAQTHSHTRH